MSRSLLRNTLFYLPAQFLGPLVQFALVVAWTHLLDPGAFGVVTFAIAAQELTALLGLMWWSIYMLRFRQRHSSAQADRFVAMDSRMVAFGALAQIAMAPLCLAAIGAPMTPALLGALAFYLVVRLLLGHYSEWARSDHRIAAYSFAQIAGPAFGALSALAAIAVWGPDPAVTLAALAAGQSLAVAGLMAALGRAPGFGDFDRVIFADAVRFGLPLVAAGGFAWIAANGVRVLVQYVDGVVAVGLLSAGWGLGQRISNVIAMVCTAAAFPLAVDRIEAGDRDGALRQVATNAALMFALLTPACVGLALLAGPLVDLMIAADYRDVTRVVMPVAMLAGAVRTLRMHTADQVCLLVDRTRVSMMSNLADAAAATMFAAVGLYLNDIVGAAVGATAGTLIASAGSVAYASARLKLRLDYGVLARIGAAAAAMALALRLTPTPVGFAPIAADIVLGAVVYALALALALPELRRALTARLRRRPISPLDLRGTMAENERPPAGGAPD
jgi:O-antigen/teichoic acid export membrane protein